MAIKGWQARVARQEPARKADLVALADELFGRARGVELELPSRSGAFDRAPPAPAGLPVRRVPTFPGFDGRIIAFDSAAAVACAEIRTRREEAGLAVTIPDAMIAATALAYGASVATRNVGDFIGCGIGVVNPWGGS